MKTKKIENQPTVLPWIIARGDYYFFCTKRGQLFQILLTESRALNILFYYPLNQKIITSYKLNRLFKCSKFDSLINFQCQYPRCQSLNRHWSILLDQTPLQLDREGIKEGEDGKKGGGGNYFKYFHLRAEIIRRRRLIKGRLLFKEIQYVKTILQSKQVKFLEDIYIKFRETELVEIS